MLDLPPLAIGAASRQGPVTVLPLFTTPARRLHYQLGTDAVSRGVLEVREGGGVDRLDARNRGSDRVFILEGDHLIGAKQNRIAIATAMIAGKARVTLPAACVERGRWQGTSMRFGSDASVAPAALRRIVRHSVTASVLAGRRHAADQDQIWATIADQQRALHVTSPTAALSHTYSFKAHDIGVAAARVPHPAGATGVALGLGGELLSIDLFDSAHTCGRYWTRLVEGAVLDSLSVRVAGTIGEADVRRVIDQLGASGWTECAPVGEGRELRAGRASLSASALVVDDCLVHLGVATAAAAPRVSSASRVMRQDRHDLPEALAGRYRIAARIGIGGAKEVFRATDLRGGPDVAIARLFHVEPDSFQSEVALLGRVQSDHVARMYEGLVDDEGHGYIVMEYCDGPTLADVVRQRGALPIDEAGPILVAYARGLRDIHAAAVLHRDVKLENAVLCGRALKLLDFGLASRARDVKTDVGAVRWGGTLPHMAREALLGERVDARTDVFAFAVCCYRLLVGGFHIRRRPDDNDLELMNRLARVERHDLSRLPPLPEPVGTVLARMFDTDRARRPFMPEVVAAFERGFGVASIAAAAPRPASRRLPIALEPAGTAAIAGATPERVLVARCDRAPIVALETGDRTVVRALDARGATLWSRTIDARLVTGLRADLDGDGVREIFLAGPDRLVVLDAAGSLRLGRHLHAAPLPSLIAIRDPHRPAIVVDGQVFDGRTTEPRGALPFAYAGDGDRLIEAPDARGVAYHGHALQAFRGDNDSAAAIVGPPGAQRFWVAHLEEARPGRVHLVVYGPGGARLHRVSIAQSEHDTLDETSSRIMPRRLFGPDDAPLALLDSTGAAVVIAPLIGAARAVPPTLVAIAVPDGRELWRHALARPGPGRALLADVDGDGRPELLVGDGRELVAYDPWTGEASDPVACTGLPVAFGDPFGSGHAHLVTTSVTGVEIWRGPRCRDGAMQWSGPRADTWRTGTLRADGMPLGPV